MRHNACVRRPQTQCDIIVGNDDEFTVLAGGGNSLHHAQTLARLPERIVVHKMGEKGCVTFTGGKRFDTPIFAVKALKPTGAGDAFMGGFMAGLVAGADVPDAVQRGAATAAIVVTKVGCAPAMPDAIAVRAFMQKHTT